MPISFISVDGTAPRGRFDEAKLGQFLEDTIFQADQALF
jgi:hypothetical protein